MPIFPTLMEARNYRMEMEAKGLKCTLESSLMGFTVTCTFALKTEAVPRQVIERKPVPVAQERLIEHRPVEIPNIPTLREYQKEAVDTALRNRHVMIVLPTGAGKTEVALAIINHYHKPAIIITPTITLVEQWVSRTKRYGGTATAVSSEGVKFSPLTVITYASALRRLPEVLTYDIVVFDEVHHLFSPEYRKIVQALLEIHDGTRLIGLTASPRAYGTEKELQDEIFPERYVQTVAERQKSEYGVKLRLRAIPIELTEDQQYYYDRAWKKYYEALRYFEFNFQKMVRGTGSSNEKTRNTAYSGITNYNHIKEMLSEDPEKIDNAAKLIRETPGQFILFGDTTKMVDVIYERLRDDGVNAVRIHSNLKQNRKERETILEELRSGRAKALLGAIAIEEGLDIPNLDNAIFLSIVSPSERRAIQRLGRILRPAPGKQATLYIIYAKNTIEEKNLKKIQDILGFENKFPEFSGEVGLD